MERPRLAFRGDSSSSSHVAAQARRQLAVQLTLKYQRGFDQGRHIPSLLKRPAPMLGTFPNKTSCLEQKAACGHAPGQSRHCGCHL